MTQEQPITRPLTYTRGMTVSSPVRPAAQAPGTERDPLTIFLERKIERFPGVKRDLFRFSGNGTVLRPKKPVVVTKPVETAPVLPVVPQRSPEEIAAENARADLSRFRFLGYLTDTEGTGSSLFLSKDGELFIAKSGDRVLKNYLIKSSDKDHVVLMDTVTKVEVRVELTGSGAGRAR